MKAALGDEIAARGGEWVVTREAAMLNSVVNRSRDLVCGTLACFPFDRVRGGESLGAGWLTRPDPFHSRPWFVAWVTDDLFFHGLAFARVTARDGDGQVLALDWLPYVEVVPDESGEWVTWYRTLTPGNTLHRRAARVEAIRVLARDLVVFESPVAGLLRSGREVLTTAARLNGAAERFAATEVPAGWIKQNGGEPLTDAEALALTSRFSAARRASTTAYLNESADYHESSLDPSRLQLVEGRSYQDAATARLCNMPAFTVGVAIPGDSMTYKTALTARLDLLDFGLQPYVTCWEETLSAVLPRGQAAVMRLEGFLRTSLLMATAPAESAAVPIPTGAP